MSTRLKLKLTSGLWRRRPDCAGAWRDRLGGRKFARLIVRWSQSPVRRREDSTRSVAGNLTTGQNVQASCRTGGGKAESHPTRTHLYHRATNALAAIAIAGAGGGCAVTGGGGRSIGGAYLYTSQDGATVETLNLVRHGSRLTGNAELLAAVTSDQASCAAGVLNAYGRPVSGCPDNSPVVDPQTNEETAPTDNAACGGTPMCFEDLTGSADGRLGGNSRISVRVVWNDAAGLATPPITSVGTLRGDGFGLDGQAFMPSDSQGVAKARSKAPMFLRTVVIPANAIHLEISALQKPAIGETETPWDEVLAQDVSTLQSDVNEANDPNQLGCDYSAVVTNDIKSMQSDVTAEAAEITKARKLVSSVTRAVARDADGDIATVRGEIAARQADLSQKGTQANAIIGQAKAEAPKVESALQQIECGAIHLAFHLVLEAGD